jgi:hypothetical protein
MYGRTRCPLCRLENCTWWYPILKVPTVGPGPTSGEVVNPQVEPTYFSHVALLKSDPGGWSGSAPLIVDTWRHLTGTQRRSVCHG